MLVWNTGSFQSNRTGYWTISEHTHSLQDHFRVNTQSIGPFQRTHTQSTGTFQSTHTVYRIFSEHMQSPKDHFKADAQSTGLF